MIDGCYGETRGGGRYPDIAPRQQAFPCRSSPPPLPTAICPDAAKKGRTKSCKYRRDAEEKDAHPPLRASSLFGWRQPDGLWSFSGRLQL